MVLKYKAGPLYAVSLVGIGQSRIIALGGEADNPQLEQCARDHQALNELLTLILRRHAAYRQPTVSIYLAQRNDGVRPHHLNIDERRHSSNVDVLPHSLHSEHEHH